MLKFVCSIAIGLVLAPLSSSPTQAQEANCPAALSFSATPMMKEAPQSLCQHKGKVVLFVNTASQCGFTPQYEGLERLHRKYASKGLVVLGFPANDFGGQEPGKNQQIAQFCQVNYGVTFTMHEKLTQPIAQAPLFAHLAKTSGQKPQWNFHKYLVARGGKVSSFESGVEPESAQLVKAIESALAEKAKL
jgi:glutathione peroxidase